MILVPFAKSTVTPYVLAAVQTFRAWANALESFDTGAGIFSLYVATIMPTG